MGKTPTTELYPLLWTPDVAALADWAIATLGFDESWRAPGEDGQIEHAELLGFGGKVSINIEQGLATGPSGIALRVDDAESVDRLAERARGNSAEILRGPEHSRVAYSFTAVDPDGNQWWVHAETGFLDTLRGAS